MPKHEKKEEELLKPFLTVKEQNFEDFLDRARRSGDPPFEHTSQPLGGEAWCMLRTAQNTQKKRAKLAKQKKLVSFL